MANKSVTVGILLAAGHSRRFGATNKLLTTFRDKPLILHAADTMKGAGLDHCIAVVSNEKVAEELSDFLLVKINSTDQSNSLINGLKKARKLNANRLVIMLADMPFITPQIVKSVVDDVMNIHLQLPLMAKGECHLFVFLNPSLKDLLLLRETLELKLFLKIFPKILQLQLKKIICEILIFWLT